MHTFTNNKTNIKKILKKYLDNFNSFDMITGKNKYSSKEMTEMAISILEYSIDTNDYSLAMKIYDSVYTSETIKNKIVKGILEYSIDTNDYSLLMEVYDLYCTGETIKNKIVKGILEYSIDTKDYAPILEIYKSNETCEDMKDKIIQGIVKSGINNNDYALIASLVNHVDSYLVRIKISSTSLKKIVKAVLESNSNEDIFTLYKKLFTEHPSFTGYYDEWFENRMVFLWTSSEYKYYNLQNKLLNKIKKPDIIDTVLFLSFEAQTILQDYKKIDFKSYPETEEAIKKLIEKRHGLKYFTNYVKFLKYIQKLLRSKQTILALYLLSNYCAWSGKGSAKLLVDAYVEAFLSLNRYDILAKYYYSFEIMSENLDFLQKITQFFIDEKNLEEAQKSITKMESLEPGYAYINEAKKQIDNISLVKQMLSMKIDIEHIDKLTGQDFERLLIAQFNKLGFKTKDTPATGDYGADIIVDTEDDTRFIIQCKRFKSKVNLKAVQEVVGAIAHFNGDIGIVITNSSFLNSAVKLAESNEIELWGKNELMRFLSGDASFSQISTT